MLRLVETVIGSLFSCCHGMILSKYTPVIVWWLLFFCLIIGAGNKGISTAMNQPFYFITLTSDLASYNDGVGVCCPITALKNPPIRDN